MFRTTIRSTPFISDAANDFFSNITGASFNGDVSFLSTLRALVAPRMQDDEKLEFIISLSSYSAEQIASVSTSRAVGAICSDRTCRADSVILTIFNNNAQEDNFANLELIKSSFCSVYPEWHRLEKITEFFRKAFYVLCFVKPDTKQVYLFTENINMRQYHYLQCAVLAFLPWYFDQKKGVEPEEMELIKSLREKTQEQYQDAIAKLAEKYDFRSAKIRKLLAGFETRYERQEVDKTQSDIADCLRHIESLNQTISEFLRKKHELEIRLLGLETKIASGSGESEIMEYFLSNNKLILCDVDDQSITFIAKDYLTFFDEEMAGTMIENHDSYIYVPRGRRCNRLIPEDDMEMFMRAVIEQKIRIKFCAAYRLTLNSGFGVGAISGYDYGAECRDCTPNPHIDAYACMGNYVRTINDFLADNNYIMAIEQCIASCKSLNFGDSAVMSEFMARIYGMSNYDVNMRCVELPNGNTVTPKEAIEFLKAEAEVNANE